MMPNPFENLNHAMIPIVRLSVFCFTQYIQQSFSYYAHAI